MGNIIRGRSFIILLLLFCLSPESSGVLGKVRVEVMNALGNGRILNVHCRSRDDDLGNVAVPDGSEVRWKFSVNFWGTTLFSCDVHWDGSTVHGFVAYSYDRDAFRCRTECLWMVSPNGILFSHNQATGTWDLMPYQDEH